MVVAAQKAAPSRELQFILRVRELQGEVRWGPDYQAAPPPKFGGSNQGGDGELPAPQLARSLYASSWPEKVAGAFSLYAGCFEVHDQFVYYPRPMRHPLAYHPIYGSLRAWPMTQGTFAIAEQLGLHRFHPANWVNYREPERLGPSSETIEGHWEIGAYIGDFALYRLDSFGAPYVLYMEVKPGEGDHGKPGGSPIKRLSESRIRSAQARSLIAAHYAEQMGSRIVEFNSDALAGCAPRLVTLCRAQSRTETDLPDSAVADLVQAFREGIGQDIPARHIAKRIVAAHQLVDAKRMLEVAIWQRQVRVDLFQPILWDRPLLPERRDVLTEFGHFLRP